VVRFVTGTLSMGHSDPQGSQMETWVPVIPGNLGIPGEHGLLFFFGSLAHALSELPLERILDRKIPHRMSPRPPECGNSQRRDRLRKGLMCVQSGAALEVCSSIQNSIQDGVLPHGA
jgi:hypothetical protein